MRRVGLILLAAGLAGFLFASTQTPRHAGAARDGWETARWILAGIGVMGVVFTVLPGRQR